MGNHPIVLNLTGTAGQSFGVWNASGLHMNLRGDANDYVCKGMAGGRVVIAPPAGSKFESQEATIIGNTCLYGATGGELFASGLAGERFGVRNSGAVAVVEGIGDHGCEYMTGGIIAVLGKAGINFGAGMTGGLAYVLDLDKDFVDCINNELIDIHRISAENMDTYRNHLHCMIEDHVKYTGSEWGQYILDNYPHYLRRFWLVKPKAADLTSLMETLQQKAA